MSFGSSPQHACKSVSLQRGAGTDISTLGTDISTLNIEYGDGNQTVNIEGIQWAINAWRDITDISLFDVSGVSHFGMTSDQRVFAYIKSVLS